MSRRFTLALIAAIVAAIVAAGTLAQAAPVSAVVSPVHVRLSFVQRATGFTQPVGVVGARDGTSRLFVLEKTGRIRLWNNGVLQAAPYLDLSAKVSTVSERGLLGLAFDPAFRTRPQFWVVYTAINGTVTLARFRAASFSATSVSAATQVTVLTIAHAAGNHNGGQLTFGTDNLLYWSVGDNADNVTAQYTNRLTGKILRLDVLHSCGALRYCIPASNPFATSTRYRREIWLWGLRNPWRMTVDRRRSLIWIADVGQSRQEEVDVVPQSTRGANMGWSCYEGLLVFNPTTCSAVPHTFPLFHYGRSAGNSVTGGYVYAGRKYNAIMRGLYVFGDFGTGRVWVYAYRGAASNQGLLFGAGALTSFGEDFAGEIWAVTIDGRLWSMSARAV
jgi:glucose/arabinose dehydrogenase